MKHPPTIPGALYSGPEEELLELQVPGTTVQIVSGQAHIVPDQDAGIPLDTPAAAEYHAATAAPEAHSPASTKRTHKKRSNSRPKPEVSNAAQSRSDHGGPPE